MNFMETDKLFELIDAHNPSVKARAGLMTVLTSIIYSARKPDMIERLNARKGQEHHHDAFGLRAIWFDKMSERVFSGTQIDAGMIAKLTIPERYSCFVEAVAKPDGETFIRLADRDENIRAHNPTSETLRMLISRLKYLSERFEAVEAPAVEVPPIAPPSRTSDDDVPL